MSPVRKYPPEPLTENTMKIKDADYGNGTYVASSNSVYEDPNYGWRGEPWLSFSGGPEDGWWHSKNMINDGKTGYKESVWIQLQLPKPIVLKKYIIQSARSDGANQLHQKDSPNKFKVKGSNNGSSWITIDSKDGIAKTFSTEFEKKEFTVSGTKAYRYFRLEVENVGPDGLGRGWMNSNGTPNYTTGFVVIDELSFFGEDEQKKGTIWNPLEEGFWSMSNLAMWVYIGVAAVLFLILIMVLVM